MYIYISFCIARLKQTLEICGSWVRTLIRFNFLSLWTNCIDHIWDKYLDFEICSQIWYSVLQSVLYHLYCFMTNISDIIHASTKQFLPQQYKAQGNLCTCPWQFVILVQQSWRIKKTNVLRSSPPPPPFPGCALVYECTCMSKIFEYTFLSWNPAVN